jgi:15-cis-phytoene synthase
MIASQLQLHDSFEYGRQILKASKSNFALAFYLLPKPQRQAMNVLYAFMRKTDDLSDEVGEVEQKRKCISEWRAATANAFQGIYTDPIHPALHQIVEQYQIPTEYLFDVITGVEMDLESVRIETMEELTRYCYHVASAVGLACIHIWGFSDEKAITFAEAAGTALQLTNILRDLGEDLDRGRIYLPAEQWQLAGIPPEDWPNSWKSESFQAMMQVQVEQATRYYDLARELFPFLSPSGRAIYQVMLQTYRELLNRIVANRFNVFDSRISLPKWKKLQILGSALPRRIGL